jgi:hypothetical protein
MRPKNEWGFALPMAHRRLDMAPFHEAALFAIDADPRSPALPYKRKIALIDKAVDHVIDGDKPPGWVFATDDMRPENRFLRDLWQIAVNECARVRIRERDHV